MRLIKYFILSWSISLTIFSGATAQDVTGRIVAAIEGNEQTWFVTSLDGTSQSDWSGDPNFANVSIWGHPVENTTSAIKGSLLIGFQLVKSAGDHSAWTVEVSYLEDGYGGMYRVVEDDDASLTVESVSLDGDLLTVSGAFTAAMFYATNYGRDVDPSNSQSVEGAFTVTLSKLEM